MVFNKHHKSMIFKKPELKEVFPNPPMVSLRQPPNLRRLLCKSTLNKIQREDNLKRNTHRNANGWKKCGKMCKICPYTSKACTTVTSQITGYTHIIKQSLSCDSENILYYWKCIKRNCKQYPKCEYIGLSTITFGTRFSEHLQYVRSEMLYQPAGEHFNMKGHEISHLEGLAIELVRNKDPFVLRARESRLMQKFDTFRNGLNKES